MHLILLSLCFVAVSCHDHDHDHDHDHSKVHECAQHERDIIKGVNLHQIHVPYKNHPYEQVISDDENDSMNPNTRRRRGLSESETSPIRISAYYDPDTIETRDTAEIHALKAVIGAIVNYYENTIRVVPVDGTFYMERFCNSYYTVNGYINCIAFNGGQTCQDADVPDSHYRDEYLYYYPSNYSAQVLPGGDGILDTDLMLYVTSHDTTSCSGTVLAHAGPCAYDQYGRPMAGGINVCEYFFSGEHEWKKDVQTMLHEMTHITIMLSSLWDEFKYSNGSTIPESQVYDDSVDPPLLKSPKVLETVRDHYDCDTAEGLAVQSSSSSHWHLRYAFSENMNPTIYSQQMYYSKFTLALMEDSGWYLPNYEYAEPFEWGKDAGCDFLEGDCYASDGSSNFPQFICDDNADDGCNADYSAPSGCYSANSNADDCRFRAPYTVKDPDYESVCWDVRGNNFDTAYQAETWAAASRCAEIETSSGTDYGYCMVHTCNGWDGSQYNSVTIDFSNSESVTCSRAESGTSVDLSSVSNRALVCPDIDTVCGTNTNFGSCYWGHYSDVEGKCICGPGYTGSDCNTKDNTTDVELTQPVSSAPTSAPATQLCLEDFTTFTSYNNDDWTYVPEADGLWNPYPSYYNADLDKYIYFSIFDHTWYLAATLGKRGGSGYCECQVSEFTEVIGECDGNWYCKSSGSLVLQPTSTAYFGACGSAPSVEPSSAPTSSNQTPRPVAPPSKEPTPSPSKGPTRSPTKEPTMGPTKGPSKVPTPSPVVDPTVSPTKGPTKRPTPVPSPNPTVAPTSDPTPSPSDNPSPNPTVSPSDNPTPSPSDDPSADPTSSPSRSPSPEPTKNPTTKRPTMKGETPNPTDDPTSSPTQIPSTDPSVSPSDDPTISPSDHPSNVPTSTPSTSTPTMSPSTGLPTTSYPTLESVVTENATMVFNANFNELESYASDNNMSNEEVAELIVLSSLDLSDYELSNIEVTIIGVYEGSVIIDYLLVSNIADLVSNAMENIDNLVGNNITIGSDFVLELDSNTPSDQLSVVVTVDVEYTVIGDGCGEVNHTVISELAKVFTNDWRSIDALDLEYTVTSQDNDDDGDNDIVLIYEAVSESQDDLDKFERKLGKTYFVPRLQSYLSENYESNGDGGCFDFYTNDDGNDNDDDDEDDGTWNVMEMFDFANYGTTEYLVVILAGLVCCICGWCACCISLIRKSKRTQDALAKQLSVMETASALAPPAEDERTSHSLYGGKNMNSTLIPADDEEGLDI